MKMRITKFCFVPSENGYQFVTYVRNVKVTSMYQLVQNFEKFLIKNKIDYRKNGAVTTNSIYICINGMTFRFSDHYTKDNYSTSIFTAKKLKEIKKSFKKGLSWHKKLKEGARK